MNIQIREFKCSCGKILKEDKDYKYERFNTILIVNPCRNCLSTAYKKGIEASINALSLIKEYPHNGRRSN